MLSERADRVFNIIAARPPWTTAREIVDAAHPPMTWQKKVGLFLKGQLIYFPRIYGLLDELEEARLIQRELFTPENYIPLLKQRYGDGDAFLAAKAKMDERAPVWGTYIFVDRTSGTPPRRRPETQSAPTLTGLLPGANPI